MGHKKTCYLFTTICLRFIISHLLNHLGESRKKKSVKISVFSLEKLMEMLHKQLTSICITNIACYCSSSNIQIFTQYPHGSVEILSKCTFNESAQPTFLA